MGNITNSLTLPAPAKLNLFLHVVGRRADGYHLLQTLFRFIDFGDTLHFTLREDGMLRRTDALDGVPQDRDLCLRAARLLQQTCGCALGVDISLEKRIPMGGGLGGGSSDAATTLLALNHMWGLGCRASDCKSWGYCSVRTCQFLCLVKMRMPRAWASSCRPMRSQMPGTWCYFPRRMSPRPRCLRTLILPTWN